MISKTQFLSVLSTLALGANAQDKVNVGLLHSLTGTMAISEITVVNAELLAIEEINAKGGVLGRQIVPAIHDGASLPPTFAIEAQKLVNNASIVNVFGCWTSSSRKAVKPIFEASNILLWYPVQYEGQECSKSIFYGGATPNQQIEPAVKWLLKKFPNLPFYLVGSDYVFPRTANDIIKSMLVTLGRDMVGEAYVPLPANDAESADNKVKLEAAVDDIKAKHPNGVIIFNTLNGDANIQLFNRMTTNGMGPDKYPTMSVSISETEISAIGKEKLFGHYASWNYFMGNFTKRAPVTDADFLSKAFIENYQARFGNNSLLNDPMEAAYINVYMWALAVEKAQTFDAAKVRTAAYDLLFDAPEGTVAMRNNHHLSKYVRIGQVNADGLFDIAFESKVPVYPEPWNQYLKSTQGYVCNHKVTLDEKYKPESIPITLLYSASSSGVLDAQMMAIEQVNYIQGGLLGKPLVPQIVNVDGKVADVTAALADSLAQGSATIFATSLTPALKAKYDSAIAAARAANASFANPLVYLPPPFAGTPSENTVYAGLSANQFVTPSLNWLQDQSFTGMLVLGEKDSLFSNQVAEVVNKQRSKILPEVRALGSCFVTDQGAGDCLSQLNSLIMSASRGYRLVIINSIPQENPFINQLFALIKTITSVKIQVVSANIDETRLTANMAGHASVASYFMGYSSPENAVFLSSFRDRYGDDSIVTDAMEKSYNAIRYWFFQSVTSAKSTNPTKVRVNGWTDYDTPSGRVTLNMNNRVSTIVRIAKVINVGGKIKYRVVVGSDGLYRDISSPVEGEGLNQNEAGYFGPIISIPATWDALRGIVVALSALTILVLAGCLGWLYSVRKMLIIKLAGSKFLSFVTIGCIMNCIYCLIMTPVQYTQTICTAQFWPLHIGFMIIFSALIYRCYNIFQATRRAKFTKKPSKAGAVQIAVATAALLLYFILRSILETDMVEVYLDDIVKGVSIQKTFKCRDGPWEFAILGVEALMVIVGVALALQIRNIQTAFKDSFSMGVCVYVWAVVKIITQGLVMIIPYNYQVYYGLKCFGELITCWHTAHLFLYPKYEIIRAGKGNEEPVISQTSGTHGYSSTGQGHTGTRSYEEERSVTEKPQKTVIPLEN